MKQQGINTVNIDANDEIELKIDRDELVSKFADMHPGSYENTNGSELEFVGGLPGDSHRLYVRLHAPWSPNNVNVCWKLIVYNYTLGDKTATFSYEFKTMCLGTMDWFIHCNLLYMF